MLRMELPGKMKRGRPKRRFMDVVKEDMAEVEVTEEDTEAGNDPRWEKLPEEVPEVCWVKLDRLCEQVNGRIVVTTVSHLIASD